MWTVEHPPGGSGAIARCASSALLDVRALDGPVYAGRIGTSKNNGAEITTRRTAPGVGHIPACGDMSPKAAFTPVGQRPVN